MLDTRYWMLDAAKIKKTQRISVFSAHLCVTSYFDAGYSMLDVGYWMLDTRCLMLDTRCLVLDVAKIKKTQRISISSA